MRESRPPGSERPNAASPTPTPLQPAGRRSGEGSASVLEHLIQDRTRYADQRPPVREPGR